MHRSFCVWMTLLLVIDGVDGWVPTKLSFATTTNDQLHRHSFWRRRLYLTVNNNRYTSHFDQQHHLYSLNDDTDEYDLSDDDGYNSDGAEVNTGIPQLPPIGATSVHDAKNTGTVNDDKPFVANHKFQIQYTCNICETRNTHNISRIAYRQGVVIVRCKGCNNQHIIADHLGYTNHEGGFQGNETNTIEDYFANDANNKNNVTINRVTTDVFRLEKILQQYKNTASKSGAIVTDDGKLALE